MSQKQGTQTTTAPSPTLVFIWSLGVILVFVAFYVIAIESHWGWAIPSSKDTLDVVSTFGAVTLLVGAPTALWSFLQSWRVNAFKTRVAQCLTPDGMPAHLAPMLQADAFHTIGQLGPRQRQAFVRYLYESGAVKQQLLSVAPGTPTIGFIDPEKMESVLGKGKAASRKPA